MPDDLMQQTVAPMQPGAAGAGLIDEQMRRRMMAQMLMQQGQQGQPQSVGQGVANGLSPLMAFMAMRGRPGGYTQAPSATPMLPGLQ